MNRLLCLHTAGIKPLKLEFDQIAKLSVREAITLLDEHLGTEFTQQVKSIFYTHNIQCRISTSHEILFQMKKGA